MLTADLDIFPLNRFLFSGARFLERVGGFLDAADVTRKGGLLFWWLCEGVAHGGVFERRGFLFFHKIFPSFGEMTCGGERLTLLPLQAGRFCRP